MKSSCRWAVEYEPNNHDRHFRVANWTSWNRTPILIYSMLCLLPMSWIKRKTWRVIMWLNKLNKLKRRQHHSWNFFPRQHSSAQLRRNFEVPDMKYLRYRHWNRWPYWELRNERQIKAVSEPLILPDFVLLICCANREISAIQPRKFVKNSNNTFWKEGEITGLPHNCLFFISLLIN